jgi:NAD-dependent SIR2 family protein deacetylase
MNRCSNCHQEYEEKDLFKTELGQLQFCMNCKTPYGKNRHGYAFMQGMEVHVVNYHSATEGRIFVVKSIFIYEGGSESGRMVYLVDKETEKPMKKFLDINYLQIIPN